MDSSSLDVHSQEYEDEYGGMQDHRGSLLRGIDINAIPEDRFQVVDLDISDDEDPDATTGGVSDYGEGPLTQFRDSPFHSSEYGDVPQDLPQDFDVQLGDLDGDLMLDPDFMEDEDMEGRAINYITVND